MASIAGLDKILHFYLFIFKFTIVSALVWTGRWVTEAAWTCREEAGGGGGRGRLSDPTEPILGCIPLQPLTSQLPPAERSQRASAQQKSLRQVFRHLNVVTLWTPDLKQTKQEAHQSQKKKVLRSVYRHVSLRRFFTAVFGGMKYSCTYRLQQHVGVTCNAVCSVVSCSFDWR